MVLEREFDWDDAKVASNLAKHNVSFPYGTRVFLDVDLIDIDASQPEDREVRRKVVGMIEGRLFTLVYTDRNGVTRIISACRSNTKEGKLYGPVQTRPE